MKPSAQQSYNPQADVDAQKGNDPANNNLAGYLGIDGAVEPRKGRAIDHEQRWKPHTFRAVHRAHQHEPKNQSGNPDNNHRLDPLKAVSHRGEHPAKACEHDGQQYVELPVLSPDKQPKVVAQILAQAADLIAEILAQTTQFAHQVVCVRHRSALLTQRADFGGDAQQQEQRERAFRDNRTETYHSECVHSSASARVDCRGNRRHLGAHLGALRAELLGEVTAKILDIGIEPIHTLFEPTFEPLEHECKEAKPYGPERYQCGELRNVGHRSIPSVWSVPIADAITPAMPNTTTMMPVNIAISDGLPSIFASSRMKSALT